MVHRCTDIPDIDSYKKLLGELGSSLDDEIRKIDYTIDQLDEQISTRTNRMWYDLRDNCNRQRFEEYNKLDSKGREMFCYKNGGSSFKYLYMHRARLLLLYSLLNQTK